MIWEYIILGAVLAWAVFYLCRIFTRKQGCACDSCPVARQPGCSEPDLSGNLCGGIGESTGDGHDDGQPHQTTTYLKQQEEK